MRIFVAVCAVLLAVLAVAAGAIHFALHPPALKIAIPANDPLDQRLFGIAADTLRQQGSHPRIEMVPFDNAQATMEALEADKVKLAVVRSDAALQGHAETVLIVRREVAVLIAPKVGKVQKIGDLVGAMVGVTREAPLDGGLLQPVLDYYGIPRDKTKYMALPPDEIAAAFRQKKVDAIIAVGATASRQMGEIVAEAARGVKGAIQFIDIEEADAIAKRLPALESVEVDQGAFGGRPPRPADSVTTLGYTVRLVATQKLDTDTAAELVRQLYLVRQNLSTAVPGAGLLEAPDTDEATAFLIHPGTRAYINGDQKTLIDRYSDWIYLGAFLASGLGSAIAGMFSWLGMRRDGDPSIPLRRVQEMLERVPETTSIEELNQCEREADEIFRSAYAHGIKNEMTAGAIASFDLGLRELRNRIAARRAILAG